MYDFDVIGNRTGTGAMKWRRADEGLLTMGLADMDFAAAPQILDALSVRVDHGVFGYTDTSVDAIEAFTTWVGERHTWTVDPSSVVVSPGVMQSLVMVLRALLAPGAGVIVQTPVFGPILEVAAGNGFDVIENPLVLVDGRYELDFGYFETLAGRSDVQAFVLCSPHNPGGRVWSRDELARLAGICAANGVTVISDEIHGDLTYPWSVFTPYGIVAPTGTSYAALTGPSKAFNLPGMRTSLTVVVGDELREGFDRERRRVNEDFGVSAMGIVALEAAYRSGGSWLDALMVHLAGNVVALDDALSATPIRVMRPDATFLAWLDCRSLGMNDQDLIAWFEDLGIVIEPGPAFGATDSGFVRLNIATTSDRVATAAARIAGAL